MRKYGQHLSSKQPQMHSAMYSKLYGMLARGELHINARRKPSWGGALNSREAILLTSSVLHCITSKYLLRKPAARCMSMNGKTESHLT